MHGKRLPDPVVRIFFAERIGFFCPLPAEARIPAFLHRNTRGVPDMKDPLWLLHRWIRLRGRYPFSSVD